MDGLEKIRKLMNYIPYICTNFFKIIMKISVCLATYNGGKYIKEQLDSILSQLDTTDEVIISDDGSSDNTLEVIKKLNEDRIKIVPNKLEKGYSKNFENAISHASGDIIF